MKRILTILLILTFCTVQTSWAGDVIIIGSDGQARYEDESKNIKVTSENIQNTKQKNILNEVTITDDTGKRECIYIDYKGNVKKVDEEQISLTTQNYIYKTVETEHSEYINKAQKTLYNINSILDQYEYGKKDNSSKSKKEYIKMNLLDGDYVIGYKNVPYLAEYHKDGSLMGLVKADKKFLNDQKGSVIFYEYRTGYNTTNGMGLKHVLFLDFEKGKYISQYIYKQDGKLLCRQINNDIYVAQEARNMIPDWSKRHEFSLEIKDYNKKTTKVNSEAMKNAFAIATAPVWGPICLIGVGVVVIGFLTMVGIFGFDHH